MSDPHSIGDFEQLVLLAVLQLGSEARAAAIRTRIEEAAERSVSRGALYATLDRLVEKGMIDWEVEAAGPARGGIPRRCFRLTDHGLAALRQAYRAVSRLADGLDGVLEGA